MQTRPSMWPIMARLHGTLPHLVLRARRQNLTKAGAGTLQITGPSTYGGSTSVARHNATRRACRTPLELQRQFERFGGWQQRVHHRHRRRQLNAWRDGNPDERRHERLTLPVGRLESRIARHGLVPKYGTSGADLRWNCGAPLSPLQNWQRIFDITSKMRAAAYQLPDDDLEYGNKRRYGSGGIPVPSGRHNDGRQHQSALRARSGIPHR